MRYSNYLCFTVYWIVGVLRINNHIILCIKVLLSDVEEGALTCKFENKLRIYKLKYKKLGNYQHVVQGTIALSFRAGMDG